MQTQTLKLKEFFFLWYLSLKGLYQFINWPAHHKWLQVFICNRTFRINNFVVNVCVPFPGKVTKELKELYNFMHNQMFQSSETWLLPNFPRDYLERKLGGLRRSPPPVRTEPVCSLPVLLSLQETPDPELSRTADSSIPAAPGQDCFWTITPRCPPASAVSWALPTLLLFPACKPAWTSPIPGPNPRPQPPGLETVIICHLSSSGALITAHQKFPTLASPQHGPPCQQPGSQEVLFPSSPQKGPPLCLGLQLIARAPSPALQNSLASSPYGLMPQPQAWSPCSWGLHWPRRSWLTSPDSLLRR